MLKRVGIGVLAVMVLALGVTGIVLAQEPTPPAEDTFPFGRGHGMRGFSGHRGQPPAVLTDALGMTVEEVHEALAEGQTVAELAKAQGIALEDIVAARRASMIERIQQAVDEGRITQEQADERIEQMEEHLLEGLESGTGFGMGGHGSRGRLGAGGAQPALLAKTLGMTVEEVHEALAEGQTVAELAEAQDIAWEDIVSALNASMSERIQQAMDEGRITQEQADERIEQMEEHLLEGLESGTGFGMRMGRGDFRGYPGGRWNGCPGDVKTTD